MGRGPGAHVRCLSARETRGRETGEYRDAVQGVVGGAVEIDHGVGVPVLAADEGVVGAGGAHLDGPVRLVGQVVVRVLGLGIPFAEIVVVAAVGGHLDGPGLGLVGVRLAGRGQVAVLEDGGEQAVGVGGIALGFGRGVGRQRDGVVLGEGAPVGDVGQARLGRDGAETVVRIGQAGEGDGKTANLRFTAEFVFRHVDGTRWNGGGRRTALNRIQAKHASEVSGLGFMMWIP